MTDLLKRVNFRRNSSSPTTSSMACEQDEMALDTQVCYYCNIDEFGDDLSWTDEEADE